MLLDVARYHTSGYLYFITVFKLIIPRVANVNSAFARHLRPLDLHGRSAREMDGHGWPSPKAVVSLASERYPKSFFGVKTYESYEINANLLA